MDLKGTLFSLFVSSILPVLITGLAGIIAAGFGYLTVLLRQRWQDNKWINLVAQATEVMKNVVAHSEVTLRPAIQKATADGILTDAEAKELKAQTLAVFRTEFGAEGLQALKDALGSGTFEVFLSGLLERALLALKITQADATPAPVSP